MDLSILQHMDLPMAMVASNESVMVVSNWM